jgi:uncharacterized protein YkuJ
MSKTYMDLKADGLIHAFSAAVRWNRGEAASILRDLRSETSGQAYLYVAEVAKALAPTTFRFTLTRGGEDFWFEDIECIAQEIDDLIGEGQRKGLDADLERLLMDEHRKLCIFGTDKDWDRLKTDHSLGRILKRSHQRKEAA